MSGVGGAPGAPFNGVQNCQGNTLAPGASCEMLFSFSPTGPGPASGTSNGAWNGVPFSISLSGTGVSPYVLVGFAPPLDDGRPITAGSRVPVRFALLDGTGEPVAPSEAEEFAATCSVVVTFTGDAAKTYCARYDAEAGQFVAVVAIPRNLVAGVYELTAELRDGTLVLARLTSEIAVQRPGRAP
jgi:hypothetical protein